MADTNQNVAHLWAQRTRDSGGRDSLFFKGDTIYSYGYHFPIAKLISDNKVLFTLMGYSNSTARHISYVRGACSHLEKVWTYDIDRPEKSRDFVEAKIKGKLKSLARARKPQIYIDEILREVGIITDIQKEFPKIKVYKKDYPLLYEVQKRGTAFFDEKLIEKINKNEKKEADALLRKAKEATKEEARKLELWRNNQKGGSTPRGQRAYLRVKKDGNILTSKGITLNASEAKLLYLSWTRNPDSVVGATVDDGFKVDACSLDKIVVGCHTVYMEDALFVAQKLGWVS